MKGKFKTKKILVGLVLCLMFVGISGVGVKVYADQKKDEKISIVVAAVTKQNNELSNY